MVDDKILSFGMIFPPLKVYAIIRADFKKTLGFLPGFE
jgi:hypothetical protein